MWAGTHYLLYNEPKTGRRSDLSLAYQLDGDWMAKFHGLPGVFRPDRAKITLQTMKRTNIALTPYGAANLATPEGRESEGVGAEEYGAGTFFVPELDMLGATYMYEGERDFGLELVRRCQVALNQRWGSTWDQPNVMRSDTGQKTLGTHILHNMFLWTVPSAALGQDFAAFCAPGGLVDRMIKAAKSPGGD